MDRHELESGHSGGVSSPQAQARTPVSARGSLDSIRVLDTTTMLSGPYCTRLMADCGAEIIKVEPAQGDLNSGFGRPDRIRGGRRTRPSTS